MKLYNAYIKKNSKGKIDDLIIVKEGFSFAAFIFWPLWFLYQKMWRELVALVVAIAILGFIPPLSASDKILFEIFFAFIIALNANYWYEQHLQNKGYEFLNLVISKNRDEAIFTTKEQYKESHFKNNKNFDDDFLDPKHSDKSIHKLIKIFKKKLA